jgi:hypothetical protein
MPILRHPGAFIRKKFAIAAVYPSNNRVLTVLSHRNFSFGRYGQLNTKGVDKQG